MRVVIAAAAMVGTGACTTPPPRIGSASSIDLYREARMESVHVSGWAPCGRNDGSVLRTLANVELRLDRIAPWLRVSAGEEAFARVEDEIWMEAGTFDPLCTGGSFDPSAAVRRIEEVARELERRAVAVQRRN